MKTGPRSYGSTYAFVSWVNSSTESNSLLRVLRLSPKTIMTLPV